MLTTTLLSPLSCQAVQHKMRGKQTQLRDCVKPGSVVGDSFVAEALHWTSDAGFSCAAQPVPRWHTSGFWCC